MSKRRKTDYVDHECESLEFEIPVRIIESACMKSEFTMAPERNTLVAMGV